MGVLTQPAGSTQPVQQQINALEDGAAYNPTGDLVYMAFVPQPNYGAPSMPAPARAWNTAYWETDPGPVYWASASLARNSAASRSPRAPTPSRSR